MKHSLAPRRAFTLIEILVVIAIIGILSAILFPVLSRARENGRKTACLSNMKQLGMAFQQYAQDSRGKYPLAANYQAWTPGNAHWVAGGEDKNLVSIELPAGPTATIDEPKFTNAADVKNGALFPYVKSDKVYMCPSAKYGNEIGLSYSMNCALSGLSSVRVLNPGDVVLLVDEKFPTDGWFYARNHCPGGNAGCSTDTLQDRHNSGGNLLFADGHVKFFSNDQFVLDYSTKGLENKSRMTGSPRFHDRAFGSVTGSSLVAFQDDPGVFPAVVAGTPAKDSCLVPVS